MSNFIKENPVWFMAGVNAIVAAGLNVWLAFWATMTGEQVALINLFVGVVVAFGLGLYSQRPVQQLIERRVTQTVAQIRAPR